jgi:hypothetical protein
MSGGASEGARVNYDRGRTGQRVGACGGGACGGASGYDDGSLKGGDGRSQGGRSDAGGG